MKFLQTLLSDRATLMRFGMVGLLTISVALIYLWQHMVMVDLGYRIETARKDMAALSHQRGELLLEVANLSSLDRVERIARERLGMDTPDTDQLVRVVFASEPAHRGREETAPLLLAARAGG